MHTEDFRVVCCVVECIVLVCVFCVARGTTVVVVVEVVVSDRGANSIRLYRLGRVERKVREH